MNWSSSLNSAICENPLKPTVCLLGNNPEDVTMGNFADKTFKEGFDIGWLTAAIEGEGHITLAWCRRGGTIQLMPRIGMSNKDKVFIDTAKGICESLSIPCYMHQHKNGMFAMNWYGMKRVQKMLDVLMPYLTFKKERAQLVLDFINYRLARNPHIKYGPYEKEIFMKVRDIHGKGFIPHKDLRLAFESNLNDYTLDVSGNHLSKDIVCSA